MSMRWILLFLLNAMTWDEYRSTYQGLDVIHQLKKEAEDKEYQSMKGVLALWW